MSNRDYVLGDFVLGDFVLDSTRPFLSAFVEINGGEHIPGGSVGTDNGAASMLHPEAVLLLKVSISYKELQFMIFQKSDQNSTAILGHLFSFCENWRRRVFPRGSCCFRGKRVLPNFLAEQCRHLEPFFSILYKE